jgi:hypothetical protein
MSTQSLQPCRNATSNERAWRHWRVPTPRHVLDISLQSTDHTHESIASVLEAEWMSVQVCRCAIVHLCECPAQHSYSSLSLIGKIHLVVGPRSPSARTAEPHFQSRPSAIISSPARLRRDNSIVQVGLVEPYVVLIGSAAVFGSLLYQSEMVMVMILKRGSDRNEHPRTHMALRVVVSIVCPWRGVNDVARIAVDP